MEVDVIEETTPPVTFLQLERATSVVWNVFGFETSTDGRTDKKKRTEVVCKLCKKELKYTGGTSNLHFHLENHHQQDYETERSKVPLHTTSTCGAQSTLQESWSKSVPLPRSSDRYKNLTKSVCYFICKDTQPFDTVNDQGYNNMLSFLADNLP